MANKGHTRYQNIERDYSGGIARYKRKPSGTDAALRDSSNPENAEAIAILKEALRKEVDIQAAQRRAVFMQKKNPKENNDVNTGDALRARNFDAKQTTKNIEDIIRKLARFGVTAKQDKSGKISFKPMKEGGETNMIYDVTKLKQMKLETFQESAAGNITKEAADYLLKYFDVMIEEAKGEDIETLVTDYVSACKDGDDEKKEELRDKITAKKNCKKAKSELADLKEKLSDEEKQFVDELDAEICGDKDAGDQPKSDENGKPDGGDEPVNESGENEEGCGSKDTQKAASDTSTAAGELEEKIKKGAEKAGEDNKEAFDQLLSAASESAITDIGKEALLNHVTESVACGDMDADVAIAITQLMSI